MHAEARRGSAPYNRRVDLTGSDHPPRSADRFARRGAVDKAIASDLVRDGVAVVQGPAGSGTSWLAMAVARRWQGPVTWIRPGLWVHLGDLARPLWSGPAALVLQQGTAEQLVRTILALVDAEDRLVVLDDFDETLRPGPGPTTLIDPELQLLLAALNAGELRRSGAAFLLASRRSPPGLTVPVRPLPSLSTADAEQLSGRTDLPDAWLRRPGALALARHAGAELELSNPDDPWGDLVLSICQTRLTSAGEEVLLGLSSVRNPAPLEGVAEAVGLDDDPTHAAVREALVSFMNLGLAEHRPSGWRCPRAIAAGARAVLVDRLPGVLPDAIALRLGAWYFRDSQDFGQGWESADPALPSRLGLRYACHHRNGPMALPFALHGGVTPHLERFRAWRMIRDDLGLALEAGDGGLPPRDVATAWLVRARVAGHLADHRAVEESLAAALPIAEEAAEAPLLRETHTRLAMRELLAGDPERARTHLVSAIAVAGDDLGVRSDLQHQLGAVTMQAGELNLAEAALRRSLDLAEEAGDVRRTASRKAGLAGVVLYRGQLRDARALLVEAAATGRAIGDVDGAVHRMLNVALIDSLRGEVRAARGTLGALAAEIGGASPRARSRFLSMRANLKRLSGDLPGAEQDLEQAEALAAQAGDREAVADLAGATGRVEMTAGRFSDALMSMESAILATARGSDPAIRAARAVERHYSAAWFAADRLDVSDLIAASRATAEAREQIPERPFWPRWLTATLQATETGLLASMLAGTTPIGTLRQLARILDTAERDEERARTGEPALRFAYAWACTVCGRKEDGAKAARKAAFDARLQGLATLEGHCAVLLGRPPQPWNGQAATLARVFGRG